MGQRVNHNESFKILQTEFFFLESYCSKFEIQLKHNLEKNWSFKAKKNLNDLRFHLKKLKNKIRKSKKSK